METLFEATKPKKDRPKMAQAYQVMNALRLRYPKDQYALLAEVGNSTGFGCSRHADAVVMGLWPSRGLQIYGIEVKVRRSDWLKELEQPEKADAVARYCDHWYVAVGDAEIVKPGELPPLWGLLVPKDEKTLRCAKEAGPLPDVKAPDRGFIASMMRQAQSQLTNAAELEREFQRGRSEGLATAIDNAHWKDQRELDELRRLRETVQKFEAASGVEIRMGWNTEKIGESVKLIMNGALKNEHDRLRSFRANLADMMTRLDHVIEQLTLPTDGVK